jgi:hypothetical protein
MLRSLVGSQSQPVEATLLQLEFTAIYLTHKYGPFQGHNISSITHMLPACLPTHLYIQLTDGHLL